MTTKSQISIWLQATFQHSADPVSRATSSIAEQVSLSITHKKTRTDCSQRQTTFKVSPCTKHSSELTSALLRWVTRTQSYRKPHYCSHFRLHWREGEQWKEERGRGVIIKIWTGIRDMPEVSDTGAVQYCYSVSMRHRYVHAVINTLASHDWTNPCNASEYQSLLLH
jgi:hypothetical protein